MCHVSPTGGGVLNNYGRGASEFMYSFPDETAQKAAFGVLDAKEIYMGGDVRYIDANDHKFLMQADVEAALKFKSFYLVGSGGQYNGKSESREYYIMRKTRSYSIRAGKFFKAYGLGIEDHTTFIRDDLGLGEGRETTNLEASVGGRLGEVVLGVYDHGFYSRLTSFSIDQTVVGVSFDWHRLPLDQTNYYSFGPYITYGFGQNYLLLEADQIVTTALNGTSTNAPITYIRFGTYVYRGFELRLTREDKGDAETHVSRTRFGIVWTPVPHLEFTAENGILRTAQATSLVNILLLHFWL